MKPEPLIPVTLNFTRNTSVEQIHGQRIKIEDQGTVIFVEGEVGDVRRIQKQVESTGIFQMPAGKITRGENRVYIGDRYIIESDPGTLDRIVAEGSKFRLPPEFAGTPAAPTTVKKSEGTGTVLKNAARGPILPQPSSDEYI